MKPANENPLPHSVTLAPGAQAVVNGAIVTATGPCDFEVGSGAFVVTGGDLSPERKALQYPHEELYFSMLDASTLPERFEDARFRLFGLLAQVVAQSRTHAAQRECSACAAAMMSGDAKAAIASAARLVAARMEYEEEMRRHEPPLSKRLPERRCSPFIAPRPRR